MRNLGLQASHGATRKLAPVAAVAAERGVAVELCAGLGGIGVGLRALGFHVARAYDSREEAVTIYNHNVAGEVAVTCNVLSEKGWQLVDADRQRIGEIDLIAAGPPCKGFSQLRNGYHDGRSGPNRVLAVMPEYVALLRPRVFLIENVPELVTYRKGKTLSALLRRLERPARGLSYRVEHNVYDAASFGTPQARRRVLILGVREGSTEGHLPMPGPDLAPLFAAVRHGATIPGTVQQFVQALRDADDKSLTTSRESTIGRGNCPACTRRWMVLALRLVIRRVSPGATKAMRRYPSITALHAP